jgi:outer membrane murein-binding lipoprotein Lpp
MKKVLFLAILACGTMMLAGCGNKADENKTPAQIQAEVQKMDASEIQAVIADYQKAIEKKAAELKKGADKLAAIPLTEQLGDEAKKVRANMDNLKDSLAKLQANLKAYTDGLTKK